MDERDMRPEQEERVGPEPEFSAGTAAPPVRRKKGFYLVGWVFLGLQAVTVLLTVLLVAQLLDGLDTSQNTFFGALAAGVAVAVAIAVFILLGAIVFTVFGALGFVFAHLAVRTGQGGGAAKVQRIILGGLTGLSLLFLLITLVSSLFS